MTSWIMTLVDLTLALVLLGVAAVSLATRDLFRSIVLFMVFGLFMALVWARLQAPDVALAEAALGAGFTGALLLGAYRRNRTQGSKRGDREDE